MIKTITIINIQAHKHLVLDLTKGLNIIAGKSDTGKSSIMRALDWVFDNDDSSWSTFRRNPIIDGTGKKPLPDNELSSVEIEFDDGQKIIRERNNKTINQYRINDSKEALKALRTGVPEEVQSILRFNQYNIRSQYDILFLIQESAAEISRKLNEVSGLEIIDSSLKKINSIVSEAKKESEAIGRDIKKKEEEIDKLAYLDNLKVDIERYEEREKVFVSSFQRFEKIESGLDAIKIQKKEIEELEAWIRLGSDLESISDKVKTLAETEQRFISISDTLENIAESKDKIESLQYADGLNKEIKPLLTRIDTIKEKKTRQENILGILVLIENSKKTIRDLGYVGDLQKELLTLIERCKKTDDVEFQIAQISRLMRSVATLKTQEVEWRAKLKTSKNKLAYVMKRDGICPTCFKPFTEEDINKIAIGE